MVRSTAAALLALALIADGRVPDPSVPAVSSQPSAGVGAHSGCPRLPFVLSRRKVVLEARLGASKTAVLLLDTGMPTDGLFLYKKELKDALAAANWSASAVRGAGSGGAAPALVTEGVAFSIGQETFTGQRVTVLQTDTFAGFPSDGVIGHTLFGHHMVEIDYDSLRITLHDAKKCAPVWGGHRLPLTFKDGPIPWVEATFSVDGTAGIRISAYIDLASREALELLLRERVPFKMPDDARDYYLGRGVSGDIHGKRGRIAWLRLGPYTLRNVAAAFAPAEVRSRQRDADAVLGNDAIRRFNVVFDYAGGNLYLKPNSHFDEPYE